MATMQPVSSSQPPTGQLTLPYTEDPPVSKQGKRERTTGRRTPERKPASAGRQGKVRPSGRVKAATAETLASHQREISVSEFFAKNRHLLGFDNKRKALLTTVKEAVDNSLDACEEGGILPELDIAVKQVEEDRFRVTVRDNGPGIVKQQIPPIFGKLLYGSKFHRLKMSRGQQGIGISAAGMYGLITTGKPIRIISRVSSRSQAHLYRLAIDTKKNRPDIITDEPVDVDWPHGTEVSIELVAAHNKGRQSVDEYLDLTAIANPHARFVYHPPVGSAKEYPRSVEMLPEETREIKPHPYGIELGTLMKMLKDTKAHKLGAFMSSEFSRVSPAVAKKVCAEAGVTNVTWVNSIAPPVAEKLYNALQSTKLKAPSTDCLAPIGAEAILSGLLKGIKAEFYTASTRPPAVYRGNPFQIEVGVVYGGELGSDHRDGGEGNGKGNGKGGGQPGFARVIRFANRVPLLYQQSSCCTFKGVVETKWNNYGLSQSSGAMPRGPMVILIHMASVWVPFTSEGKEAIADYDEIRKEVRLAIAECGRRLATLLRRKRRKVAYTKRRDVFTRYIDEVVEATRAITVINKDDFRRNLIALSKVYTAQADMEFDEHGKLIKRKKAAPGNELGLADTIVVDANEAPPDPTVLFDVGDDAKRRGKGETQRSKRGGKVGAKRARKRKR